MILRFLVLAGIVWGVLIAFRHAMKSRARVLVDQDDDARLGRLVQDPQCGVYVDSREAVRRKAPGGELFFCSKACARDYLATRSRG